MNVIRNKNGNLCVDNDSQLSPDQQKDIERLSAVAEELTALAFRETPTVAVSALITALGRVVIGYAEDPLNESIVVTEGLQVFVRHELLEMQDGLPLVH